MKKYFKVMLTVGAAAAITATTAFGQNLLISVDEWGIGYANGTPLPSQKALEPFSGLTTIAYTLPFPAIPGDVQLIEPDGTTSDVLRFDANSHLFFFSDWNAADPPDAPADVGIPSPVGSDGNQSVDPLVCTDAAQGLQDCSPFVFNGHATVGAADVPICGCTTASAEVHETWGALKARMATTPPASRR